MAPRNRPSTIDRLPKSVREKIGALRDAGHTIDQIIEALNSLLTVDEVPSRSAIGRHIKKTEQITARIRESRQIAEAITRNLGDKQASDVVRMNLELLQDMILRASTALDDDGNEVKFDAKDIMFLATALEKAAKASKSDFDQQIAEIRELERKETTKKAADTAVAAAKKRGLSTDTIQAIKASILGVV